MSTSKQTFDQVKSILGKLDRSIDAARARRLDPHPASPSPAAAAPADPRRDEGIRSQPPPGADLRQARPLRPDTPGPLLAQPMNPRPDSRRI